MSMSGILDIKMHLEHIGFPKLHVDTKGYDIVSLQDDYYVLETRDFSYAVSAKYEMITNPAILGDFGAMTFDGGNQTNLIKSKADINDDGHLEVNFT